MAEDRCNTQTSWENCSALPQKTISSFPSIRGYRTACCQLPGALGGNPCPINAPVGNWRGSRDNCREQGYGFANGRRQVVVPRFMTVLCSENRPAEVCEGCENKCAERECAICFSSKRLFRAVVVCTGIACLYLRVNVAPKATPDVTVFIMVFPPLR